jgi:hypothetical protein
VVTLQDCSGAKKRPATRAGLKVEKNPAFFNVEPFGSHPLIGLKM